MTLQYWVLLTTYVGILLLTVKPVGAYLVNSLEGKGFPAWLSKSEVVAFKWLGIARKEMNWKSYLVAVMLFNLLGVAAVFVLQKLQAVLPYNPQHFPAVPTDLAFNTAISFVTNTNWQNYGGESTMSYLTQMLALAVQNFLSAATGIAVAFALIRGLARHSVSGIGNFWIDIYRVTLYVLLPASLIIALLMVSQGVIQNFSAYQELKTLDSFIVTAADGTSSSVNSQVIPMGPVASQEAIKMLGTNGGGFFNANSAHPFENPNYFINFIQMLAIFILPAGLCYAFGLMVGDTRQGWAILAAMLSIFLVCAIGAQWAEQSGNPILTHAPAYSQIDSHASALQSGGNMEGKETRFGIAASSLFATITTAASCGAVNGMHDSFTPLGGMIPMLLMQLGEVVFGGVGSGLYGMLVYALTAVFISGLMIGRTPEYIGKKIESFDMKMIALAILVTPAVVLVGTAIAVALPVGASAVANPGPHGFSEILYALSSAANNNGSAFAGLSGNSVFYNLLLAFAMFIGRFGVIIPVLALAGSLAAKKRIPAGSGTLPTTGPLFVGVLVGAVLLVGALNFVPALALGPIVEHLLSIHAAG